MTTLLALLWLSATPAGEGELKVVLTPKGESEYAARIGGSVPLVGNSRLLVQMDSKACATSTMVGGRLAVMTDAWAVGVALRTDTQGDVHPSAHASLTLTQGAVGKLELSAKIAPRDDEKYVLAAAFSPNRAPVQVRVETRSTATSISISFRSP
jgi:hypothetical protein